jgi:hypothetical protein
VLPFLFLGVLSLGTIKAPILECSGSRLSSEDAPSVKWCFTRGIDASFIPLRLSRVVGMNWRQKQWVGAARGAGYSESREVGHAVWTFSARGDHLFGVIALGVLRCLTSRFSNMKTSPV